MGLQNYMDLLASESFRNSLKVTLIFVVIVVVGGMLLGLIAAVLCNKAFPGIRFSVRLMRFRCDRVQFCGNGISDHAASDSRHCK